MSAPLTSGHAETGSWFKISSERPGKMETEPVTPGLVEEEELAALSQSSCNCALRSFERTSLIFLKLIF